ncbi:MAG: hypothetical protein OXH96_03210 [Spirochaetaceae bacterium]|nr:hypothetical protein [Spirochaetaceae bacterium]
MARGPSLELSGEQVRHFLERGDVGLEQVLSRELAELAALRALAAERLDFRPTAPRERVAPERAARQARMPAEQEWRGGVG